MTRLWLLLLACGCSGAVESDPCPAIECTWNTSPSTATQHCSDGQSYAFTEHPDGACMVREATCTPEPVERAECVPEACKRTTLECPGLEPEIVSP